MRRRRPHLPPSLPAAPAVQCPHHHTGVLLLTRPTISPAGGAPLPPPAPSTPAAAEVHRRRFRGLGSTAATAPPLHDALTPAAPLQHRYPPRADVDVSPRGRRSRRSRPFAKPPHIMIRAPPAASNHPPIPRTASSGSPELTNGAEEPRQGLTDDCHRSTEEFFSWVARSHQKSDTL